MSNTTGLVKDATKAIVDALPDGTSWEDIQYHLNVRQKIEAGLEDEAADRLIDTDEMQRRLAEHKEKKPEANS